MRYLIIILLISTSCCPKVTENVSIQRDTTTIYETDTIVIPQIREVFASNIQSLCDSISKLKPSKDKVVFKIPAKNNANAIMAIVVDSLKDAEFVAMINDYEYIADSLREVIRISEKVDTKQVAYRCENKFHTFAVWLLVFILVCVAIYAIMR